MNTTSVKQNCNVTSAPCDQFYEDDRSNERSNVFLYLYIVIIIIGIPFNSFFLYVSWKHIRQRNDLGVYLFVLALSDLLSTASLALFVDYMFQGVWLHGKVMCVLSVILLYTNFYTSDGLLCCIALNRYLAVVHPLKYTTLRRVDTAVVISMVICALVVSLNTATVIWVKSDTRKERLCFQLLHQTETVALVNVTRFVLGFLFPILMVSFCCRGICVAVRSNQATEEQERRRVFRLLGVVLLTLGLCLGPIHIIMLLCSFCKSCGSSCPLMYKVSLTMSALNILADPFLYCFVTRLGKAHVTQVMHFLKRTKDQNNQELVWFDTFQPHNSFSVPE